MSKLQSFNSNINKAMTGVEVVIFDKVKEIIDRKEFDDSLRSLMEDLTLTVCFFQEAKSKNLF